MSSTTPCWSTALEPMLPARDADHDLIQVPFVSGSWGTPADLVGKALTKLQRPLPDGFVANLDASGGEHLLDHAQAQGKPKVQPHGMADHFGGKAVAGVTRGTGRFHPLRMARSGHPSG
jgi:hypothetical protein